ncbi:MAG: hypothetical protein KTR31_05575 [Myxococcales bacterium]|nr:hypothetical protein [Myxococcales bacterium]
MRLHLIGLLALPAVMGCGNPCQAASDYKDSECGIPQFADSVADECGGSTEARCLAECDLETACDVLNPPALVDPADQADLQDRTEAYEACQEACPAGT